MLKVHRLFEGDRVIWVIFFFLCAISLIEVYSAGSTLTYRSGKFWDPLVKQFMFLSMGLMLMFFVHKMPYRFFKMAGIWGLLGCTGGLWGMMFLGHAVNGAKRWVHFGFIQFQPSEIAKGCLLIFVALLLTMRDKEKLRKDAYLIIVIVTIIVLAPIFSENISTSAFLFAVVVMMLWIGRAGSKRIFKLLGVILLVGALLAPIVWVVPADSSFYKLPLAGRLKTAKSRIEKMLSKQKEISPKDFDIDKDAQIAHSRIAIASCNYVGVMPGNSIERDFLSQAYSDFIYAIIIEETGLWGAFLVLFLYVVLLFRARKIAKNSEYNFPGFLVLGLALLMVTQAFVNMLVAVGIFPVTGQTLPLISRGGTSMIVNCVYLGMILSVSRTVNRNMKKKKMLEAETAEKQALPAEKLEDDIE